MFPYCVFLISQLYQSAMKEVRKVNLEESEALMSLSRELSWGISKTPTIADYMRAFSQNSYDNNAYYLGRW